MLVALATLSSGCERSARGSSSEPKPLSGGLGALAPLVAQVSAASASAPGAKAGKAGGACGASAWSTYAHDARRSSASDACCEGPLRELWRAAASSTQGREAIVAHAIADGDAAYATGVRGDSPFAARFDAAGGKAKWLFDSHADISRESWPSLGFGKLLFEDDGLYFLDAAKGERSFTKLLDMWGETLSDEAHFYMVNTWHIDGPGAFVAALGDEGKPLWQRNRVGGAERHDAFDQVGAIALDGGVLFQAASHRRGGATGVFAYDAATGEPKWSVTKTVPQGHLSAGEGRVYLVEKAAGGSAVVARSQTTGERLWSTAFDSLRSAAPVLAGGLVIVSSSTDGVVALRDHDGGRAWSLPLPPRKAAPVFGSTDLAAALGSRTLVVASGDELRVVGLDDGVPRWSGRVGADVHSPIIVGDRVYAVSVGWLVALGCE